MPYLPNTTEDDQAMLRAIGVESIDALFDAIPQELRYRGTPSLPKALGEFELASRVKELSRRNHSADELPCFLGGGCYDHFIPSVVDHLGSDPRCVTAYTPYQAEASQGNLQVFFEYQTMITELTGLEVSNASLYDGSTACLEAVHMAMAATRRDKVLVAETLSPEYRQVMATCLREVGVELVTLPAENGLLSLDQVELHLDDATAAVVVAQPNFLGRLEPAEALAEKAHAAGALLVASVDPISLGLLRRPGDWGADIVTAEGQPLGIPMTYGGPYLGVLACREKLVRRMPGRLIGQTQDRDGRTCWVLTMQTREQHIRREKATSNICTNQGLMALRATVYLAAMGPQGLREVANLCLQKAHYLAEQIVRHTPCTVDLETPFFKEFVVRLPSGVSFEAIKESFLKNRVAVAPGVPLDRWWPEREGQFLVAVTEKRTRDQLDRYVQTLAEALV
jgi:glycine dehydrogenase subunit 1